MARLIPPYIKDDIASNAERRIFNLFLMLDYDCTVLHSLGISQHRSKVYGEIDFVVICREGILCLEIKGGEVYREDGVWHFINRYGHEDKSPEGPFNQVIGSMFSLREYIKKSLGNSDSLAKCQYACGVVFPDIVFNQRGPEFINEIVYDARKTDEEILQYMKNCFKYWREQCEEKYGFKGDTLTNEQIRKAEMFLRGNFGAIPSFNIILDEIDKKIVNATEDQYSVLEMLDENNRVIIKGGAGTGKTLIGLEHCRRLALKGQRVLYLCFNKLLSDYLKHNLFKDFPSTNIVVSSFHSLLNKYLNNKDFDSREQTSEYYEKIMPEQFIDYVIAHGVPENEQFDAVIIDEGQDLLRVNYLMCLSEIIKSHFASGKWYLFYDLNQNIYNKEFEEGMKELVPYSPVLLTLSTNCRNTRQIGIYNTLLSGIKHEKYMKINGEEVIREGYSDESELRHKLLKLVKNYKAQGTNLGNMVILSPYTFDKSCLKGENIFKSVCSFQNITGMGRSAITDDSIKFSTIHSFKGMEARIIILVDLDKFDDDFRRYLYYIAVSRARSILHIFYKETCRKEMDEVMKKGFILLSEG